METESESRAVIETIRRSTEIDKLRAKIEILKFLVLVSWIAGVTFSAVLSSLITPIIQGLNLWGN